MATNWRTYNERHKVVQQAQRLARSGQYADHTTILPLLQHMEGFEAARARLEDRALRLQLDRLCAAARNPTVAGADFAAMRRSPGAKAVRQNRRSLYG